MSVLQIDDNNFEEKVVKAEKPVLLDFYADWCGPCKMAAPIIDQLSEEYKEKLVVGKVDVDNSQMTAMKFGVMSIPTVILFNNGIEVERQVGFGGRAGYDALIKKVTV